MSRIVGTHNSVCVHCGEGNKVETIQRIVACSTCGAEDPDFVPFFPETSFFRDNYERQGKNKKTRSFKNMNRKDTKKEKKLFPDRYEDTSGYRATMQKPMTSTTTRT